MARKATDLLDVFRHGGGDDDDDRSHVVESDRARTRRTKKKSKARAKAAGRKGFDGVILTKRQVILAASACCLLVAGSFVLGLTAGRPGAGDGPAMQRSSDAESVWVIRGAMHAINPGTQKAVDVDELRGQITREFGVPNRNLRIYPQQGRLVLEIGPFGSEQRALDYLRKSGLDMAHVSGADPFLRREVVRLSR